MSNKMWDRLWIHAKIACDDHDEVIQDGAIAIKGERIAWVGTMQSLQGIPSSLSHEVYDVKQSLITPGLIDCHTHLIYAGNRANEFAMRLEGASYTDIAKKGGGIQATVKATRAATEDHLFQQSLIRAQALMESGVTTIEIKSGYGLDIETELKMLRVAKRIESHLKLSICKTFLGAHTFPTEYLHQPEIYVNFICEKMIPMVAKEKYADAVDVFCESIAFNIEQTEKIFKAAKQHGLSVKCHAEQLSHMGAATLAAKYNALSADHLEHLSEEDAKAMSQAGLVAVLLPGAYYFLREKKSPPIDLLRKYRIPIPIPSDCNPGPSPMMSILLILNMACVLFHLTPKEALKGVTENAAKALGIDEDYGSISVGKVADLAIWNVSDTLDLFYTMGCSPLKTLIKAGKTIIDQ